MLRQTFFLTAMMLTLMACSTPKTAGLRPLSPENGGTASDLKPLLKWTAAKDHGGTYDLVIFEAVKGETSGKKERLIEVYYREGLPGGESPDHQVETPLNPAKQYRWSVREREGDSFGEWAKMETQVFTGISYHRRVRLFNFFTP